MKNIDLKVKGDILTITVNLKERSGKSASGKTDIIATTSGNVDVEGQPGVKLGINCYFKEPK